MRATWVALLAQMRAVFDAVSLLPGDQATVQAARRAGLAVVLEFDYKKYFFAGQDIGGEVRVFDRFSHAFALSASFRKNSKTVPWKSFPPVFVIKLTFAVRRRDDAEEKAGART